MVSNFTRYYNESIRFGYRVINAMHDGIQATRKMATVDYFFRYRNTARELNHLIQSIPSHHARTYLQNLPRIDIDQTNSTQQKEFIKDNRAFLLALGFAEEFCEHYESHYHRDLRSLLKTEASIITYSRNATENSPFYNHELLLMSPFYQSIRHIYSALFYANASAIDLSSHGLETNYNQAKAKIDEIRDQFIKNIFVPAQALDWATRKSAKASFELRTEKREDPIKELYLKITGNPKNIAEAKSKMHDHFVDLVNELDEFQKILEKYKTDAQKAQINFYINTAFVGGTLTVSLLFYLAKYMMIKND